MGYDMEPMMDLFIYETEQLTTKMEELAMDAEDENEFNDESIQEIFRAMHTIKGSAAMMMFDQVSTLAHILEDLFDLMRNNKVTVDVKIVSDFVFETVDYIKSAMERIKEGESEEVSSSVIKEKIKEYVAMITGEESEEVEHIQAKQYFVPSLSADDSTYEYEIIITFSDDCTMENIRAYTLMNAVKAFAISIISIPGNLLEEDDDNIKLIRDEGFRLILKSNEEKQVIRDYLTGYPYVDSFEVLDYEENIDISLDEPLDEIVEETIEEEKAIEILLDDDKLDGEEANTDDDKLQETSTFNEIAEEISNDIQNVKSNNSKAKKQANSDKMISVNVDKLDRLMDLVGELVVSESIVSGNEEVVKIQNDILEKALRMHRKIINDVQDVAMSIRMVPLSGVFQKMKRLVRDAAKKLDKDIELIIIGEQTEVDKNIIEKISDPLMHLIRNSCDHGIETKAERETVGKNPKGRVTLEARNSGGEVFIIIKDDGKGLNPDIIFNKAIEKELISPNEARPSDSELFSYIFKAGFSTKEQVSDFSGRGVGMDVAIKNIEQLGGMISVSSDLGVGTTFTIKIPLTMSIIDGMKLRVGNQFFIIPITGIQQSFRIEKDQYIKEPSGMEMILLRGVAYSLLRLYRQYNIVGSQEDINEGIVVMVGNESNQKAIFADELLGEQQVVVKPLPAYLNNIEGISGCAILGDGGISLIIDLDELLKI